MFLKTSLLCKAHKTNGADIRFVCVSGMLVIQQLAPFHEHLVTSDARVRIDAWVRRVMNLQLVGALKGLWAFGARE